MGWLEGELPERLWEMGSCYKKPSSGHKIGGTVEEEVEEEEADVRVEEDEGVRVEDGTAEAEDSEEEAMDTPERRSDYRMLLGPSYSVQQCAVFALYL